MASTTNDRDLSEAAFHSKYGFYAGWDEVRQLVWDAREKLGRSDADVYAILSDLYASMGTEVREAQCAAYVGRIEA